MHTNDEQYAVIYYVLDDDIAGEDFVMDSQTGMELGWADDSVVKLQFNWARKILRTDKNKAVVSFRSRSLIKFYANFDEEEVKEILITLRRHEDQNLAFIRNNSFGYFENFQNVFYSSFLDENLIPVQERKRDLYNWLKIKVQEITRQG